MYPLLCRIITAGLVKQHIVTFHHNIYEGWNFNSGNYLFTTDTK